MIVDGEIRALLEAAELRLEYGTPEDRYRVAGAFHEVLAAGATLATLEWAVDYLRQDPAVHQPPPGRRLCAHADQGGAGMHWLEPGEQCALENE